jgi:hypothetical protein
MNEYSRAVINHRLDHLQVADNGVKGLLIEVDAIEMLPIGPGVPRKRVRYI